MALNLQDLEDFAEGRGAGAFSPQQGSMLPAATPTRQGGLPLGMGPSVLGAPVTSADFGPSLPSMPAPTGTPPGMPPGLPLGPPSAGPAQGLAQLGGAPPSLQAMLQQGLTQMNTPRPWGRGEGIGNILQSIGAGLQGQKPTWMAQEEHEMERRQRALQLGLTMQQLNQQGEYQQAQMGHMNMQNNLLRAQAYEHGTKMLDWVSERVDDPSLTPEQRNVLIASTSPMLSALFATGASGDPNKEALARDPQFIQSLLEAGGSKAKNFIAAYPLLDANGQRAVTTLVRAKNYHEAVKVASELSNQNASHIVNGIVPQWQRVVDANPRLNEALSSGKAIVTLEDALGAIKATPQQRHAVNVWMASQKPEVVDAVLLQAGIASPFAEAERKKAYMRSQATELGQESTPGGQAKIEGTRATTAKTVVDTRLAPYKTIPGQGGMMTYIDVGTGLPKVSGQPAGGGAGVSVGPIPDTPTSRAVTGQPPVASPDGLQLSPNVTVVARTPLPGMAPESARMVMESEQRLNALKAVDRLLQTGNVDSFIGPMFTGARFNEWSTKNLPEVLVGKVPNEMALLDMAEGLAKNVLIRARTGAAVRIDEEPRLLTEGPDRTRDKPSVYREKLRYAIELEQAIGNRERELLGPDGKLKLGVSPDDVARRYPLPQYGDRNANGRNIDTSGWQDSGSFRDGKGGRR